MKTKDIKAEQLKKAIWSYDLSKVKNLLMREHLLDEKNIDHNLEEYRKYMFVLAATNIEFAMTNPHVDAVWHAHILHTREYCEFTLNVFGCYLHHDPYDGDSGTSETDDRTQTTYDEAYSRLFSDYGSDIRHSSFSSRNGIPLAELCMPTKGETEAKLCVPTKGEKKAELCVPTKGLTDVKLCVPTRGHLVEING